MLLLPEQLVDVVIEIPDPELAQPGVLDGRHALGDVPNHLRAEEEVKSPSMGGILSADLLTEDLGLPDVVTLAGQVGSPLPHLRPVPLLLLLGLAPPGQADRHHQDRLGHDDHHSGQLFFVKTYLAKAVMAFSLFLAMARLYSGCLAFPEEAGKSEIIACVMIRNRLHILQGVWLAAVV